MTVQISHPVSTGGRIGSDDALERPLPIRIRNHPAEPEVPRAKPRPRTARLLALAVTAVAGGLVMQERVRQAVEAERVVEPVPRELPRPSSFALGTLEPASRVVEVAAPDGGGSARIKAVVAREGQSVRTGQLLAVLENEDRLKAEVVSCERQLGLARVKFEQAQKITASGLDEAVSALRIAEITKRRSESDRQRIARLVRSQAASHEEHDNASIEAEIAALSLGASKARLARFASGEGQDPVDVAVMREEIAVHQAALAEARARLEQAYVRAPIDGNVISIRLRAGEYAGQRAILDMGDTQKMTARAEVYESLVRKLSPGMPAILRSAALEMPLKGTVDSISNVVRRQSIVDALPAANTDARVVEVIITLDRESSKVAARYVGLQVRTEFLP